MSDHKLEPADRLALEDILTALSWAVDDKQPGALGELLTDDAVMDVGHGLIQGRDAIVAAFLGRAADESFAARHLWSNLGIEKIDGDTVTTRCVFATFAVTGLGTAPARVWRCGDYHDVFRKTEGRWFLASRRLALAVPD